MFELPQLSAGLLPDWPWLDRCTRNILFVESPYSPSPESESTQMACGGEHNRAAFKFADSAANIYAGRLLHDHTSLSEREVSETSGNSAVQKGYTRARGAGGGPVVLALC